MASKVFTVRHTAGKTVYFRVLRLSDRKVFDFDDNTWETNLAACTNPKAAATENTDFGDATDSLYWASINLTNLNNETDVPYDMIVQAVDDDTDDTVIAESHISVTNGFLQEDLTQHNADSANTHAVTAASEATAAKGYASTAATQATGANTNAGLAKTAADAAQVAAEAAEDATDWLKDFLEGDVSIDTTGTPWELVVKIKGTATELVRKKLYRVDGTPVGAESHIIGKQLENAL